MQLRVFDTSNGAADIYGADGNTDYYLLLDGEWEKHTVSYSAMTLPAGFKGYVRVDMTQFKDAITGYIGNGQSLDLSAINGMWLWFMQSANTQGKCVYLNDFNFVKENSSANVGTEDTESPDTGSHALSYVVLTAVVTIR